MSQTSEHLRLKCSWMKLRAGPEMREMHNGWTRQASSVLSVSIGPEAGQTLKFMACPYAGWPSYPDGTNTWLSQAGHVFSSLNIRDNFDSYGKSGMLSIRRTLHIGLSIRWDTNDYRGKKHTHEDSQILTSRWMLVNIAGMRRLTKRSARLHIAKGFDPDGQDIARHLEYPVFELVSDIEARKRTAGLFNEDWEDGWTLADLFVFETQPTPSLDESACLNSSSKLKNITHESVLSRVELIVIFFVALMVWIEFSR
ncbi:hypothetical protein C8F01DRAFT_1086465 [Mycena amicta]|nr:hypothetical protein C8F01DRAFT_1086465 [Mycena amicta]